MSLIYRLFLILLFTGLSLLSCLSQNVGLYTQTDVNAFDNSITSISGDLVIQTSNFTSDYITDLSPLSNLTSVGGNVKIENNENLININPLSNLTFIGGDLNIGGNYELTSLNGLSNLASIGGKLRISTNYTLEDLDGLSNLTTIIGDLEISFNSSLNNNSGLKNLNGLNNLVSISNELTILGNRFLENIDALENLVNVEKVEIKLNTVLENFDGLSGLSSVNSDIFIESNEGLTNIDGLTNLTFLGGNLKIRNNDALINLNGLTNLNIIEGYFSIEDNLVLTELDNFPNLNYIGSFMTIGDNSALSNIAGFNNLDSLTSYLFIRNNSNLSNIDGFNSLSYTRGALSITGNNALLNVDGFNNLIDLNDNFFIEDNESLIEIGGFINLSSIGNSFFNRFTIANNVNLLNLDAFDNLTTVRATLRINDNPNLTNLDGLSNIDTLGALYVEDNLSLTNCCGIHTLLFTPGAIAGSVTITNNPFECSSPDEVITECGIAILSGFFYNDENNNGLMDPTEFGLNLQSVSTSPNGLVTYYGEEGKYRVFTEPNTYVISPEIPEGWYMTSDSTSFTVTVQEELIEDLNFGFKPINDINELAPSLTSSATRCGFTTPFWLDYKNTGTVLTSGYTFLELDSLTEYIIASPEPDSIDENILFWYFDSLPPTYNNQVVLQILMPGVDNLGDTLHFNVNTVILDDAGNEVSNFESTYNPIINCAYDPNDKQVFPQGIQEEQYTLFGQTLEYTVRFQNTGTDTAFTVRVSDQLDENLDWTTFQPLNASHDFEVSLNENGLVEFLFENILLPDSTTNLIGSNGYFKYKINLLANLPENTEIENTANIFFDFNPPIQTNTTLNTFVSELPTNFYQPENMIEIHICPNPVTQQLQIKHQEMNLQYILFHINGIQVSSGVLKQQDQLDFTNLQSGIYFLKVANNKRTGIYKVLKVN